jgi:cyclophilin family peptidyl-prolyl cis-trans isomerase
MKQREERIVVEVWPDVAPLACENFLALVSGSKGTSGKHPTCDLNASWQHQVTCAAPISTQVVVERSCTTRGPTNAPFSNFLFSLS